MGRDKYRRVAEGLLQIVPPPPPEITYTGHFAHLPAERPGFAEWRSWRGVEGELREAATQFGNPDGPNKKVTRKQKLDHAVMIAKMFTNSPKDLKAIKETLDAIECPLARAVMRDYMADIIDPTASPTAKREARKELLAYVRAKPVTVAPADDKKKSQDDWVKSMAANIA